MNKKFQFIISAVFFGLSFFLFSDAVNAQVRIDNFNVIQRTIPSTSSNVDFRLTISQQDQSLDCLPLVPFTNGSLQWIVWYDANGFIGIVRRQSVDLPLSPNPKNLDFQAPVQPNQIAIQAGSINFRAALGCTTYTQQSVLNRNLAVSAPIRVSVAGPGGPGPGPGGPGRPVTLNIPNPVAAESLVDLAKAIGKFLFQIAIPIAVIVIIYAGLLYLTSGGKPKQVENATTALKYALIGLAIILIGQGFFTLIKSILDLGGPGP